MPSRPIIDFLLFWSPLIFDCLAPSLVYEGQNCKIPDAVLAGSTTAHPRGGMSSSSSSSSTSQINRQQQRVPPPHGIPLNQPGRVDMQFLSVSYFTIGFPE